MCDYRNDEFKIEPVNDLPDVLHQSKSGKNEDGKVAGGTFARWLIEYRDRLAEVLRDETSNTSDGRRPRKKSAT